MKTSIYNYEHEEQVNTNNKGEHRMKIVNNNKKTEVEAGTSTTVNVNENRSESKEVLAEKASEYKEVFDPTKKKMELLKKWFIVRPDVTGLKYPNSNPAPYYYDESEILDDLLYSHLTGKPVTIDGYNTWKRPVTASWRAGAYNLDKNSHVANLCLDIDAGPDHAESIQEPWALAVWLNTYCQEQGYRPYIEKSGGGYGYHIWMFFEQRVPADKVRRFGKNILRQIPEELLLLTKPKTQKDGTVEPCGDIELFPKQDKISNIGNMVFLPWWFGGKNGGGQFYHPDGTIMEITEDFDFVPTIIPYDGDNASAILQFSEKKTHFEEWKLEMVANLPLDAIYGPWLTGKDKGNGFLECRDPSSASGDKHPSAGVWNGGAEHERGFFYSFLRSEGKDVIQFMQDTGQASDFKDACIKLAELSGTTDSCPITNPPEPPISAQTSDNPDDVSESVNINIFNGTFREQAKTASDALVRFNHEQFFNKDGTFGLINQTTIIFQSIRNNTQGHNLLRAKIPKEIKWVKDSDNRVVPTNPKLEVIKILCVTSRLRVP